MLRDRKLQGMARSEDTFLGHTIFLRDRGRITAATAQRRASV